MMPAKPIANPDGAVRSLPARLVLIDDDPLFVETIAANLEEAGYEVVAFDGGAAGLDYLLTGGDAAVVLLDWRMPAPDGLAVLRRLREAGSGVPIIFLTSLNDQIFEEAALAGGAVDFVEKARSFQIILQRIRLITEGRKPVVRSYVPEPAGKCEDPVGSLDLRVESGRASWKGRQVPLTLSEFRAVRLLAQHAGSDVSYRQIYDAIRGEGFIAGNGEEGYRANVRSLIKRVRQKFRDLDPAFDAIANYPGFGYRWVSDGSSPR